MAPVLQQAALLLWTQAAASEWVASAMFASAYPLIWRCSKVCVRRENCVHRRLFGCLQQCLTLLMPC